MRAMRILPVLFLAACVGGAEDSGANDGSSDSSDGDDGDSGGHGVSFGGAQDIGELRSILDAGGIPGADTLDANGFFNEHFNAPPAGACAERLCLTAGVAVGPSWLTGSYQAALQLAVSTNIDPADYTRLPMRLVVVVDHSGSMASDGRLDKVKTGLHTLIDSLHDEDRLAIVSFDDQVTVDAPFAATLDRAHLRAVVDELQPDGSTNIFEGLRTGLTLLGDAPPSDRQNRVIFLSDGLATVGNLSEDDTIAMASSHIARGIGLTTIGVGSDFDVKLMRGLAERGAGNFYFVEDATAATEVFSEELDYFLSPIALDVRVEAASAPGWDFTGAVGSSLWEPSLHTGTMTIPAVFLASRTTQNPGPGGRRGGGSMIFIGLHPTTNVAGKIADLTLSWRAPGSADRVSSTLALQYVGEPGVTPAEAYLSYPQLAERYAMYNMYIGLRTATELAETDYNCATSALARTKAAATEWLRTHEGDIDLADDVTLYDQFIANLGQAGANPPDIATATCSFDNDGNPQEGSGGPWDDDSGGCDDGYGGDSSDDGGYSECGGGYGDDTEGDDILFGCSTSTPANGLLPLAALLGLVGLRRRKR